MDGERDRRVRLGAVRAAIEDEFWDGEPARALLRMQSDETLGNLYGTLFELTNELSVGGDDVLIAPTAEPDAVVIAPPSAFQAMLQTRFVQALGAAFHRPGR